MRTFHRAVAAATSVLLLVGAWTAAIVQNRGVDDAAASQAGQYSPAIPDVHVDSLAVPAASKTDLRDPERTRTPLTAPADIDLSVAASQLPSTAYAAYRRAARALAQSRPSCHLSWPLLAAIGKIESDHGRYGGNTVTADGSANPGVYGIPLDGRNNTAHISDTDGGQWDNDASWDRAVGPMQFIPSTWSAVAVDGNDDGVRDPQNVYDAALGAGVYLCAGGHDLSTDAGIGAAVYGYNHSRSYVRQVMAYARAYVNGTMPDDVTNLPTAPAPMPEFTTDSTQAGGSHNKRAGASTSKQPSKKHRVSTSEKSDEKQGAAKPRNTRDDHQAKPKPEKRGDSRGGLEHGGTGRGPEQPATVTVPEVVGLSYGQAASDLDSVGLTPKKHDVESDEPEGQVLSSSRTSGTRVRPGTAVRLGVSQGPNVRVPTVNGMSAAEAEGTLQERSLKVDTEDVANDAPEGEVVGSDPAAGTSVRPGSTVTLLVSDGTVEVPEVLGMQLADAEQVLEDAGFEVAVVESPKAKGPTDTVTDRAPHGGRAPAGSTIRLTVPTKN